MSADKPLQPLRKLTLFELSVLPPEGGRVILMVGHPFSSLAEEVFIAILALSLFGKESVHCVVPSPPLWRR